MQWRKLAFDNVEIGAAHAASFYPQKNVSRRRFGDRDFLDVQRRTSNNSRGGEDCGFHKERSKH